MAPTKKSHGNKAARPAASTPSAAPSAATSAPAASSAAASAPAPVRPSAAWAAPSAAPVRPSAWAAPLPAPARLSAWAAPLPAPARPSAGAAPHLNPNPPHPKSPLFRPLPPRLALRPAPLRGLEHLSDVPRPLLFPSEDVTVILFVDTESTLHKEGKKARKAMDGFISARYCLRLFPKAFQLILDLSKGKEVAKDEAAGSDEESLAKIQDRGAAREMLGQIPFGGPGRYLPEWEKVLGDSVRDLVERGGKVGKAYGYLIGAVMNAYLSAFPYARIVAHVADQELRCMLQELVPGDHHVWFVGEFGDDGSPGSFDSRKWGQHVAATKAAGAAARKAAKKAREADVTPAPAPEKPTMRWANAPAAVKASVADPSKPIASVPRISPSQPSFYPDPLRFTRPCQETDTVPNRLVLNSAGQKVAPQPDTLIRLQAVDYCRKERAAMGVMLSGDKGMAVHYDGLRDKENAEESQTIFRALLRSPPPPPKSCPHPPPKGGKPRRTSAAVISWRGCVASFMLFVRARRGGRGECTGVAPGDAGRVGEGGRTVDQLETHDFQVTARSQYSFGAGLSRLGSFGAGLSRRGAVSGRGCLGGGAVSGDGPCRYRIGTNTYHDAQPHLGVSAAFEDKDDGGAGGGHGLSYGNGPSLDLLAVFRSAMSVLC
ncbi:hypothetical protein IAT38_000048 [Cryptococcus sp. DSM 104549]